MKWFSKRFLFFALVASLFGGPALAIAIDGVKMNRDWRTASMGSSGIAPDPATNPDAMIHVYAARLFGLRGALGVHTWVAVKPSNAMAWRVHEVIGWRARWGQSVVVSSGRPADGYWYGNKPKMIRELRGGGVDAIIAKVEDAVARYPHAGDYTLWPGPNSNTFTAYIGRQVPELKLDLPPTAIGKDFMLDGAVAGRSISGTGFQVSLNGVLGMTLALEEGLEINLAGTTWGIDPLDLAVKLPGLGRLSLLN